MQLHLYAPNVKILLVENVLKTIRKQFLYNATGAASENTKLFLVADIVV